MTKTLFFRAIDFLPKKLNQLSRAKSKSESNFPSTIEKRLD